MRVYLVVTTPLQGPAQIRNGFKIRGHATFYAEMHAAIEGAHLNSPPRWNRYGELVGVNGLPTGWTVTGITVDD